MNESVRDLLRQGADTVEKPQVDVGHLVAQAERRMFRRRLATVAASTVAVVVVVAGGAALRPGDRSSAPPPVDPIETPDTSQTPDLAPAAGSPTYFSAHPDDSGEPLTAPFLDLGENDIYLRREGAAPRRIVSTRAHERCPVVSPDGASLAYLSGPHDTDGLVRPAKLVVVPLDSGGDPANGSRRVVLRDSLSCPQWSPSSQSLAVVADGKGWATPELRVVTPDGKSRLLTILPPYIDAFAWSPGGDAVAYLTEDSVWIAPLDRGEPQRFWRSTRTPDRDLQGIPLPRAPTSLWWLSTGELAVVVLSDHASDGWPYVPEGPSVLHIIDVGSRHHEKVQLSNGVVNPVFSPDAAQVATVTENARQIRVYDRATRSTSVLRPRLDDGTRITLNGLSWSPEGDQLLTFAQRSPDSAGGQYARVSIAPDGSSVEVLTPWTTGHFPW